MSTHRILTAKHTRSCERCGTSRTIETHSGAEIVAGFIGWTSVSTDSLFGRFSSLGRGPYDLCPVCAVSFVDWWRDKAGDDSLRQKSGEPTHFPHAHE
jgi:hypothetical protein